MARSLRLAGAIQPTMRSRTSGQKEHAPKRSRPAPGNNTTGRRAAGRDGHSLTSQPAGAFDRPLPGWREAPTRELFLTLAIKRLAGRADHPALHRVRDTPQQFARHAERRVGAQLSGGLRVASPGYGPRAQAGQPVFLCRVKVVVDIGYCRSQCARRTAILPSSAHRPAHDDAGQRIGSRAW
jgi:hypothetical protein